MKKVLWTCKILRNEDNSGNVIQGLKMNLGIYEHELDDENRDLLRIVRNLASFNGDFLKNEGLG